MPFFLFIMFSYNITFVADTKEEARLLTYLRSELIPALFNPDSGAGNPELKKIIEAGGEKQGEEHGVSLALSAIFESEAEARLWHDEVAVPALGDFHLKFGERALFFITLLEFLEV
ncbi:MAG: DUF4286 family protein [Muribaculaceae bacterium]|nr:DUF4286 family protein [Muribaculaceae bacterium]